MTRVNAGKPGPFGKRTTPAPSANWTALDELLRKMRALGIRGSEGGDMKILMKVTGATKTYR
jgi:hypothetical protein